MGTNEVSNKFGVIIGLLTNGSKHFKERHSPVLCEECGRVYSGKGELKRHKREKHLDLSATPALRCGVPGCRNGQSDQGFTRSDALNRHLDTTVHKSLEGIWLANQQAQSSI